MTGCITVQLLESSSSSPEALLENVLNQKVSRLTRTSLLVFMMSAGFTRTFSLTGRDLYRYTNDASSTSLTQSLLIMAINDAFLHYKSRLFQGTKCNERNAAYDKDYLTPGF